jgi:hypothetical protein
MAAMTIRGRLTVGHVACTPETKGSGYERIDTEHEGPAAVTNLAVEVSVRHPVEPHWIAPRNDGPVGRAAKYGVRYALSQLTDANWEPTVRCHVEPPPGQAGEKEALSVSGLTDFTRYHFAVRVAAEVPNWSGLSNIEGCRTAMLDDIPPVIDSLSLPSFHIPVPCWYATVRVRDEASYPGPHLLGSELTKSKGSEL